MRSIRNYFEQGNPVLKKKSTEIFQFSSIFDKYLSFLSCIYLFSAFYLSIVSNLAPPFFCQTQRLEKKQEKMVRNQNISRGKNFLRTRSRKVLPFPLPYPNQMRCLQRHATATMTTRMRRQDAVKRQAGKIRNLSNTKRYFSILLYSNLRKKNFN